MSAKQVNKFHKLRAKYDDLRSKTHSITYLSVLTDPDEFNSHRQCESSSSSSGFCSNELYYFTNMKKQATVVEKIQQLLAEIPKDEIRMDININENELPDLEDIDAMLTGELAAILGFPLWEGMLVVLNLDNGLAYGIYVYKDEDNLLQHVMFDYRNFDNIPEQMSHYSEKDLRDLYYFE